MQSNVFKISSNIIYKNNIKWIKDQNVSIKFQQDKGRTLSDISHKNNFFNLSLKAFTEQSKALAKTKDNVLNGGNICKLRD